MILAQNANVSLFTVYGSFVSGGRNCQKLMFFYSSMTEIHRIINMSDLNIITFSLQQFSIILEGFNVQIVVKVPRSTK